jgi:Tol biopolymer transport system component
MSTYAHGTVKRLLVATLVLGLWTAGHVGSAGAGPTTRVSVNSAGVQADGFSGNIPSISADGRFVAFQSDATNLVPGDDNGVPDVFVHDRKTGTTERVSVSSSGAQANSVTGLGSVLPAISANGRFVAFVSDADNLLAGVTNYNFAYHVFVHDRKTGTTELVSVDSAGGEAGTFCCPGLARPAISANGKLVAFVSRSPNLVADRSTFHVFVHDRSTGITTPVSVDSAGAPANFFGHSFAPSMSANGRFVAFESDATNFVAGDDNGVTDIFVHDRITGTTTRVSVGQPDTQGIPVQGDGASRRPSISANGRFVAFDSEAPNLVVGDTNGASDVFVHDRIFFRTTRVSVSTTGAEANAGSFAPSISANGRFVAFASEATNLVGSDDTNGFRDVFVHDRNTGTTTRVSVDSAGAEGDSVSFNPSISANGRFVAFESFATNLVAGDTNGEDDIFVHDRKGD